MRKIIVLTLIAIIIISATQDSSIAKFTLGLSAFGLGAYGLFETFMDLFIRKKDKDPDQQ